MLQLGNVKVDEAARVSEDLTTRHPEIPSPQIVAILVHAYFRIDWEVVWLAATDRCPVLRGQIAAILAEEQLFREGAELSRSEKLGL